LGSSPVFIAGSVGTARLRGRSDSWAGSTKKKERINRTEVIVLINVNIYLIERTTKEIRSLRGE